ncbi:facilitated trehalose transporter Tret1-like [Eupeodes corollae]|uniref:facilitated trehalose transporter Tret1-like n=1 Tax=Eupeodes corollae TaxID=290404 RepID=UPI0024908458|nr:facilitated trehalose transporter Tret1-like [Eupeodes corollae]
MKTKSEELKSLQVDTYNLGQTRKSIPLGDQNKAVLRQELMVLLMNLGLLTGGISLAIPSVTLNQLTNPAENVHLNKSQASWFASCSSLGSPLGALMCAFMADRYGRKFTLIATNLLGIIAWALMAFPIKCCDSDLVFLQLMVSRLITGLVKGLGGAAAAAYGAEICLPKIRARLINAVTMSMACGVLFIYILGYFIRNDWKFLGMILLAYQLICLALLLLVKESPSWLMSKGYVAECKASLTYFRGLEKGETHKEVEEEFLLLSNKFKHSIEDQTTSFWGSLSRPELYKPFTLAFIFYILQQFAGTFVVIVYAVQILTKSGLHIDPFLCAVYIGVARFFVASFIMTWMLETWNRRQVGIFSAISMACCVFLLAISNWFPWLQIPYLSVGIMIAFVTTSGGIWNMPFVLCSEMFPQNVRGTCSGITDSFAYFMSFVVIKIFPSMVDGIGIGNVFAFYGLMAAVTALFIFLYIPETKGKTLLEIEEYFKNGQKKESGRRKHNRDAEMKEMFVNIKMENEQLGRVKIRTDMQFMLPVSWTLIIDDRSMTLRHQDICHHVHQYFVVKQKKNKDKMSKNSTELECLHNGQFKEKIVPEKEKPIPLGDRRKAVLRQELMVILMNLGILVGGMSLALPAVTLDHLRDPTQKFHLDESQSSWFAAASSVACPVGSFSGVFLVDRIGRKNSIALINIFAIIGWLLMSTAYYDDPSLVYVQLIISRLFSGIATGMGGSPASVYGAEVCLPKMRARLTMVASMAIASGVLFAYVVGYFFRNNWRFIGVIFLGYQIICLILLIPVKESPNWLLSKGRVVEAKASLSYLRGLDIGETHDEVEAEFVALIHSCQPKAGDRKVSLWKSIRLPEVYKPFMIGIAFFAFQQFSGTFVVVVYAVQIITKAGVHTDAFLCAIYVGIARFIVASVVMTWELEKWGRRPVSIFSAASTACCLFLLASTSWFTWLHIPTLSAITIVAFVFAAAGQWAIPYVILTEIYPQKVRGAFCGLTIGIGYLITFSAIKIFPAMSRWMGNANVFAFYGTIALLTIVFIYHFIPETKGKTFVEIESFFRKPKRESRIDLEATEVFVNQKKNMKS